MTDATSSVAEWFDTYRRVAMSPTAPPLQISECEAAFYAGAWAMFQALIGRAADMSEDDAAASYKRLEDELKAFALRKSVEAVTPPPLPFMEQSGYNVRQADVERTLREVGRFVKSNMPDGWGFCLLIASFGPQGLKGEGEGGALFYLSSVEREGALDMMREFLRRNTQ